MPIINSSRLHPALTLHIPTSETVRKPTIGRLVTFSEAPSPPSWSFPIKALSPIRDGRFQPITSSPAVETTKEPGSERPLSSASEQKAMPCITLRPTQSESPAHSSRHSPPSLTISPRPSLRFTRDALRVISRKPPLHARTGHTAAVSGSPRNSPPSSLLVTIARRTVLPPRYTDAENKVARAESILGHCFEDRLLCLKALKVFDDGVSIKAFGDDHQLPTNKTLAAVGRSMVQSWMAFQWYIFESGDVEEVWQEAQRAAGKPEALEKLDIESCIILPPVRHLRPITRAHKLDTLLALLGAVFLEGQDGALCRVLEKIGLMIEPRDAEGNDTEQEREIWEDDTHEGNNQDSDKKEGDTKNGPKTGCDRQRGNGRSTAGAPGGAVNEPTTKLPVDRSTTQSRGSGDDTCEPPEEALQDSDSGVDEVVAFLGSLGGPPRRLTKQV